MPPAPELTDHFVVAESRASVKQVMAPASSYASFAMRGGPTEMSTTVTEGPRPTDGSRKRVPMLCVVLDGAAPLAPPSRHSLADVDEVTLGRAGARGARHFSEGGVRRLAL